MNIGILTQPLYNNYGGLLQNYALQQVLQSLGHTSETVDWHQLKESPLREWLWVKKQTLLNLVNKNIEKPHYQLTRKEEELVSQNTRLFIERYIHVCPQVIHEVGECGEVDEKYLYDAYIVGSDQVWRPRYNSFMRTAMFLDFVNRDNVKKIAYAASFGTSEWEFDSQLSDVCSRLAKKFDLITVREKSGVSLCRNYLGVSATHVLDPTMLLEREDYEQIVAKEKEPQCDGTLFHYILDPGEEKKTMIDRVASSVHLLPFTIMPKCQAENRTRRDVKNHIDNCVFPSVTSWLRGKKNEKMIIVDSFHGAVFSIIFNKPFWVIANKGRGNARFESLLSQFNLLDRFLDEPADNNINWNKPIDWTAVNGIRQVEKVKSLKLLADALK